MIHLGWALLENLPRLHTCLFVCQQPKLGRRLSSCPWSARSSPMWYGVFENAMSDDVMTLLIRSFVLHSFVGLRFPIELRRSPFLLTSRPRGSPHTSWTIQVLLKHVFLLLCRPLKVKATLWTGFSSSVFFQRQNRPTSSCFRRSTRSLLVHWC